jgi:TolB-like protein
MINQIPNTESGTAEVLEELERVERSRTLANSKRLIELLRFVVEAQLRGDTEGLKQTAIGVELYGRDPSYDPKLDGVVRTHARRLRERLVVYYETEGVGDPVVITLPRGGYVPVFQKREVSAGEHGERTGRAEAWLPAEEDLDFDLLEAGIGPKRRVQSTLLARVYSSLAKAHHNVGRAHILGVPLLVLVPMLLLAIILSSALTFLWHRSGGAGRPRGATAVQPYLPRVAVLHFRSTGKGAENELFGRALADSVVASLARVNEVSVVEPPESTGQMADGTDAEEAAQLKADYVVTGRFERTKKLSKLSATLTEASGGKVIWRRDYSFPWANLVEIEDAMSTAVSQCLAQRVKTAN